MALLSLLSFFSFKKKKKDPKQTMWHEKKKTPFIMIHDGGVLPLSTSTVQCIYISFFFHLFFSCFLSISVSLSLSKKRGGREFSAGHHKWRSGEGREEEGSKVSLHPSITFSRSKELEEGMDGLMGMGKRMESLNMTFTTGGSMGMDQLYYHMYIPT